MTPVNGNFNPLPTRDLYVWKPDSEYFVASDRAQNTIMKFTYNSGTTSAQEALLFGRPPQGGPHPPHSDEAFLATYDQNLGIIKSSCIGGNQFPFPQIPPDWLSIPAAGAVLQATITNNPVLCPYQTVTIYSVLFPPAGDYTEATYLWTWYAPLPGSDGTRSRPVTFQQSNSQVNVGTSLALADYFYYEEFTTPIDPSNFAVPEVCARTVPNAGAGQVQKQTPRGPLRFSRP